MPADTVAKLRIDERRKHLWQARASSTGRSLSQFMRTACDAAAEGIDAASIRADLTRMRRFLNAASDVGRGLDQEAANRFAGEAVEIRRLVDRHLAIRGRA